MGQDSRVSAAYTELARVLDERGDREKAFETFQNAIKADPDNADAYYFFARHLAADRATLNRARLAAQEYLKREPRGPYAADAQRLLQ